MRASRDEHDVVPRLRKPRSEIPADTASPYYCNPHRSIRAMFRSLRSHDTLRGQSTCRAASGRPFGGAVVNS